MSEQKPSQERLTLSLIGAGRGAEAVRRIRSSYETKDGICIASYRERARFASDCPIPGGSIVNWNARDKHLGSFGVEEYSGDIMITDKDPTKSLTARGGTKHSLVMGSKGTDCTGNSLYRRKRSFRPTMNAARRVGGEGGERCKLGTLKRRPTKENLLPNLLGCGKR